MCGAFFGPMCAARDPVRSPPMHFRMPALSHGVVAFLWAFFLALYIWAGLLAVGASQATALVLALVAFCAIFLFVRLRGEDGLS